MPKMAKLRGAFQLVQACQAQFAVPLDIVLDGDAVLLQKGT